MKKSKIFSIVALGVCATALLTIGSCNLIKLPTSDKDTDPVRELVWTVADFETWETGMQRVRMREYFGTIRENDDPTFVKTGKKSVKIRPMGGYTVAAIPMFAFPTVSEALDYDNSDFTDVKEITFEFYNDEETPINVAVGLTTVFDRYGYTATPFEYQALAPKAWTTVKYTVNQNVLSIDYDLKAIEGIYVAFENSRTFYEEDAPEVYMDDVVLTRYETAPTIENVIQLDEYEYLDFEKDWQQYVLRQKATDSAPNATIKNASDCKIGEVPAEGEEDTRETLTAVSGDKVLHVEMPADETGQSYTPALIISDKVFKQSYLNGLPESEYGNVKFGFDIFYNDAEIPNLFSFLMYSDSTLLPDAKKNLRIQKVIVEQVQPYEWCRIEFTIKELYEMWQETNPNNKDFFKSPGEFHFLWRCFQGNDRDFYLDNIGFVYEEKDPTAAPEITLTSFARTVAVGTNVEFPAAMFYDRYDLTGKVTITAEYKDGDEWIEATYEGANILVDKVGEYRVVATAKNSLGNVTTKYYPFEGVSSTSANSKVWADYSYEDEISGIFMTAADRNEVTWLESATDKNGETCEGVAKAFAANGTNSGAGFLGFQISEQLLKAAEEAKWDYFTIHMYVESDATSLKDGSKATEVTFMSGAVNLGTYEMGKWIQLKITKAMLNSTTESWVNGSLEPVDDDQFYGLFNEVCGTETSRLLYARSLRGGAYANNDVTYYIDKIVWGCEGDVDEDVAVGEGERGDNFAYDVYDGEWADPFKKSENN